MIVIRVKVMLSLLMLRMVVNYLSLILRFQPLTCLLVNIQCFYDTRTVKVHGVYLKSTHLLSLIQIPHPTPFMQQSTLSIVIPVKVMVSLLNQQMDFMILILKVLTLILILMIFQLDNTGYFLDTKIAKEYGVTQYLVHLP